MKCCDSQKLPFIFQTFQSRIFYWCVYNRVSQNAPKCLLASIEVHVAASIPQEPPKKFMSFRAFLRSGHHFWHIQRKFQKIQRKICHQTIFALISCRKVESTSMWVSAESAIKMQQSVEGIVLIRPSCKK